MLPFGETVLLWRLEHRLSQEVLAKRANISRPNLSAIERGKREVSLKTLRSLAFALEVRPGVLVDGIGPRSSVGRKAFSRESLERIADSVISGTLIQNPEEQELAGLLRTISSCRLAALKGSPRTPRFSKRNLDKSWLRLSAGYPPELIRSLVQRVQDREHVLRLNDSSRDR